MISEVSHKLISDFTKNIGKPALMVKSPGRANLIGEHVDYCGGSVLPFAIEQSMYFVGTHSEEKSLYYSHDYDQMWHSGIPVSEVDWSRYVSQIHGLAEARQLSIQPSIIHFVSEIPIGAGLSSSTALCCGLLSTLNFLNDWGLSSTDIITMASEAEHGMGLKGGLMDQHAIMLGKRDHLLHLDCRDNSYDHVPIPRDSVNFFVLNSRVQHNLVDSEYNNRRLEVETALSKVNELCVGAREPIQFTDVDDKHVDCLLYTSPSPRDATLSRMPSSA